MIENASKLCLDVLQVAATDFSARSMSLEVHQTNTLLLLFGACILFHGNTFTLFVARRRSSSKLVLDIYDG